jgi:lysophospholipase L1-like esterase
MYKKLVKRLLVFGLTVAIFSTIISLLAGEFIIKHVMPQETYDLARMVGIHTFEESPIIPYQLKKNVDKFLHIAFTREFTHYLSTNSQSARGEEFSQDKPKDTYRILFLGDSMTFGWGVEDNQAYPYLVGKYLNQSLRKINYQKIETINAGFTDGNTLDTYYLYYKEIGAKYNPDLVIVDLFPYNDLSDMYYNLWEKTDEKGYPTRISSKTHKVVDGYLVSRRKTNWKYEIPILRNSHLGMIFLNALEKGAPQLVEKIKSMVGISKEKEVFSVADSTNCVYEINKKYCPDELWPYFEKSQFVIQGIKELAQKNNQELLFTIMASPDQAVPLSEKLERMFLLSTVNPQKYYRDWLDNEGIKYLDLLPTLSGPKAQNNFYKQDGHINSLGHKKVATQIAYDLIDQKPDLFQKVVKFEE